jgi:hypothetical protein
MLQTKSNYHNIYYIIFTLINLILIPIYFIINIDPISSPTELGSKSINYTIFIIYIVIIYFQIHYINNINEVVINGVATGINDLFNYDLTTIVIK